MDMSNLDQLSTTSGETVSDEFDAKRSLFNNKFANRNRIILDSLNYDVQFRTFD